MLDVGCGSCEKARFYHDWGARVTGIEMTPSILDLGREVVGARDIRLIQTSLFEFSPASRFDIVIADGVLHHTADTGKGTGVVAEAEWHVVSGDRIAHVQHSDD